MAQKTKTESKKKPYASMPVWDYTDEPCHLMIIYSSFSSPFISKNFVFQ